MNLRKGIVIAAFCALLIGACTFAPGTGAVGTQAVSASSAALTLEQLQQIVDGLKQQIQQLVQLIAQRLESLKPDTTQTPPSVVGGECSYKSFPGKCTITGNTTYSFVPIGTVDITGTFLESADKINPYSGTLDAATTLSSGTVIDCTLKVIIKGTCTPIMVSLAASGGCAKEGAVCSLVKCQATATSNTTKCLGAFTCCGGLTCKTDSSGISGTCVKTTICGNGKCETGETAVNCPVDCGQCQAGQTKKYACSNGTQVAWCNCANGIWVCVNSPETQCPATCAREGQTIPAPWTIGTTYNGTGPTACCDGLTAYTGSGSESVQNGICVKNQYVVMPITYLCVKCGDGVCNGAAGENVCICPNDCPAPKTCYGEGEGLAGFVSSSASVFGCCQGLTQIARASCGNTDCSVMSAMEGFLCTKCGNGVCGTGENKANCPHDCGNPSPCSSGLTGNACTSAGGQVMCTSTCSSTGTGTCTSTCTCGCPQ